MSKGRKLLSLPAVGTLFCKLQRAHLELASLQFDQQQVCKVEQLWPLDLCGIRLQLHTTPSTSRQTATPL